MIRVLLAEDQTMVRGALAALLALAGDIEVVAEAARGDEVVPRALATQPDVALLDIEMPGGDGLTAAAALHEQVPNCRVLILTTFGRPGYLRRALESGAVGFLLKDAPPTELASAVRRAAAGQRVVDPDLALSALSEGASPLTDREREVLVGHRRQLPLRRDAEDRRAQPHRGSPCRRGEGVAVTWHWCSRGRWSAHFAVWIYRDGGIR